MTCESASRPTPALRQHFKRARGRAQHGLQSLSSRKQAHSIFITRVSQTSPSSSPHLSHIEVFSLPQFSFIQSRVCWQHTSLGHTFAQLESSPASPHPSPRRSPFHRVFRRWKMPQQLWKRTGWECKASPIEILYEV